jgi:hypothetical protein
VARKAAKAWSEWLPHGRLVVFHCKEVEPFSEVVFDERWIDLTQTARLVSKSCGLNPEQVLRDLCSLVKWASGQERKGRTLFKFCRYVKALLRDNRDMDEPDQRSYSRWMPRVVYEMLLPVGGLEDDYMPCNPNEMAPDPEDLALEWDRLWEEVEYADDETLLTKCAYKARTNSKRYHPSPKYNLFLNLARHLQEHQGDEPILLPQFEVGEVIGISQPALSNLTCRAVREGLLVRVGGASFNKRRAARFRFNDRLIDDPAVSPH